MKVRSLLAVFTCILAVVLALFMGTSTANAGLVAPKGGTGGSPSPNPTPPPCSGIVGDTTGPSYGQLVFNGHSTEQTDWIVDTTGCTQEVKVKVVTITLTYSHGVPTYRWSAIKGVKIYSINWQYSNPSNSKDFSFQTLVGTPNHLTLGTLVYKVRVRGHLVERLPKLNSLVISYLDPTHRSTSFPGGVG